MQRLSIDIVLCLLKCLRVCMWANKRTVQCVMSDISGYSSLPDLRNHLQLMANWTWPFNITKNKSYKGRETPWINAVFWPHSLCPEAYLHEHEHTHTHITAVTSCCLVTFLEDSTGSNNPHRIWGISAQSLNPVCVCVCVLWLSDSVSGSDGEQWCDRPSMMFSSCTGHTEINQK